MKYLNNRGVTLIELAIVIAITSIMLGAVGMFIVTVVSAQNETMKGFTRYEETDISMQLFREYGLPARSVEISVSGDGITFTDFNDATYTIDLIILGGDATGVLRATLSERGNTPVTIARNVRQVVFSPLSPSGPRGPKIVEMEVTFDFGDQIIVRKAMVVARNIP